MTAAERISKLEGEVAELKRRLDEAGIRGYQDNPLRGLLGGDMTVTPPPPRPSTDNLSDPLPIAPPPV